MIGWGVRSVKLILIRNRKAALGLRRELRAVPSVKKTSASFTEPDRDLREAPVRSMLADNALKTPCINSRLPRKTEGNRRAHKADVFLHQEGERRPLPSLSFIRYASE